MTATPLEVELKYAARDPEAIERLLEGDRLGDLGLGGEQGDLEAGREGPARGGLGRVGGAVIVRLAGGGCREGEEKDSRRKDAKAWLHQRRSLEVHVPRPDSTPRPGRPGAALDRT